MQEAEAALDPEDDNCDHCALCGMGGSLLCCDACPAAYHMRCIGETNKSIPEGEWLCAECSLGGRGMFEMTMYCLHGPFMTISSIAVTDAFTRCVSMWQE